MTRLTGTDALGLMEAYNAVYIPQELTEEQIQEDFKDWVYSLVEEGYDLSEYTWEEMYEDWKQNIMEMPFPRVQVTNRPGDFGASQMTLIRTPGGKEGYVNPHSQGNILSPGTTNKIMRGDLMVKAKQKSKPTTQVAHFDLYDYIMGHLLDEGYADTEEDALVIMSNMSEDWKDQIIDEAQQIMSVSRGGKQIYKARRSELDKPSNEPSPHKKHRMRQLKRAQTNADRRGGESPARERRFDRFVGGTDTPLNRIRTSNIKKLNAPEELKYDYDPYRTVRTDYAARRRRASGR